MDDIEAGAGEARSGPPPKSDDSIRANVERLIASGKDLAEAELAWAKLKGRRLFSTLKRGFVFALIATAGLMVGLSLLLVAGLVALAPHVGWLNATLIIIALAFAIAAVFALLARRAFRSLINGGEP